MRRDKPDRTRKAGAPVAPQPEPKPRLLRPDSECSTADHALGLAGELKEALAGANRKPKGVRKRGRVTT